MASLASGKILTDESGIATHPRRLSIFSHVLVPAERKIFAGSGQREYLEIERLGNNLGPTGTRPVEAVNFGWMRL